MKCLQPAQHCIGDYVVIAESSTCSVTILKAYLRRANVDGQGFIFRVMLKAKGGHRLIQWDSTNRNLIHLGYQNKINSRKASLVSKPEKSHRTFAFGMNRNGLLFDPFTLIRVPSTVPQGANLLDARSLDATTENQEHL